MVGLMPAPPDEAERWDTTRPLAQQTGQKAWSPSPSWPKWATLVPVAASGAR